MPWPFFLGAVMKAFLASMMLLAASVGLSSAVGAGAPPDRPQGIPADRWVPINDRLGLVLLAPLPAVRPPDVVSPRVPRPGGGPAPQVRISPGGQALLVPPPAQGYFVIREGAVWVRLQVVSPGLIGWA